VNAVSGVWGGAGIGGGHNYYDPISQTMSGGGSSGIIRISDGSGTARALPSNGYGTGHAVGPGNAGESGGLFSGPGTKDAGGWPVRCMDSAGNNVYKWDGQRGSIAVFFNANGGQEYLWQRSEYQPLVSPLPRGGLSGSVITLPPLEGVKGFEGCFTASSGGTRVGGSGDPYIVPEAPVTLYAQWSD